MNEAIKRFNVFICKRTVVGPIPAKIVPKSDNCGLIVKINGLNTTNTPVGVSNRVQVILSGSEAGQFYRLKCH